MLRRSRHIPALAVAACGLLAAACSAPAGTAPASTAPAARPSGAASPGQAPTTRTLTSGPTPQYTAVAFPRPATGWLLGQPGIGAARAEIWHSVTAGRTWQPQWQGTGNPLALSATDPAHAWALIACPGSALEPKGLLRADADRHDRRGPALAGDRPAAGRREPGPVLLRPARRGHRRIAAWPCSATTRCPGQLLVSRDGGAHWTPVLAAPGPVFATAAAAGQMWAAEPSGSVISFLTSTDGGRHWRALGRVTSPVPLSPDVRLGLAAGPPGVARPGLGQRLRPAQLRHARLRDGVPAAQRGRRAELEPGDPGGQPPGPVRTRQHRVLGRAGRLGLGRDRPERRRVFPAARPALPVRPAGRKAAWPRSLPALPPWQLTQVTSLDAVSGEVAYAIGGQGLLARTGDGGLHWTELRPAPAPTGLLDVLGPATALGAQDAGDAGAILRSADGGHTWTELAHLPGVVTQLDFPVPADGVAATYQAGAPAGTPPWRLWRSRDGGLTWQAAGALPGGNTDIFGPWFSASGHGLLLTVAGGIPWEPGSGGTPPVRVWTTADWGSSWSRGGLLPLDR